MAFTGGIPFAGGIGLLCQRVIWRRFLRLDDGGEAVYEETGTEIAARIETRSRLMPERDIDDSAWEGVVYVTAPVRAGDMIDIGEEGCMPVAWVRVDTDLYGREVMRAAALTHRSSANWSGAGGQRNAIKRGWA